MNHQTTSTWRRRTFAVATRVVLFVVLGAATTVAVAWYITLRFPHRRRYWDKSVDPTYQRSKGSIYPERHCCVIDVRRWSVPGVLSFVSESSAIEFRGLRAGPDPVPLDVPIPSSKFVPAWARDALWLPPTAAGDASDDRRFLGGRCRSIEAMGWPWVAMWCDDDWRRPPRYGFEVPALTNWNQAYPGTYPYESPVFPCRPVPTGFALCTAFYGAAWFGLIAGVPWVRRRLRTGAGLCPNCRYDLTATPPGMPCPECGQRPAAEATGGS